MRLPCIQNQLHNLHLLSDFGFEFAGKNAAPFMSLPSPPLMVSDNREQVDYNNPTWNVQWQHTIDVTQPAGEYAGVNTDPNGRHRVFLWAQNHVPPNPAPTPYIGITVQNTSATETIQVSRIRAVGGIPPDADSMAACLLTDELPVYNAGPSSIMPGNVLLIYFLSSWLVNRVAGAQVDFLVNPHTAYRVRTAFGTSQANLILQTNLPEWPYKMPRPEHPRGGWDFSEILITPVYTLDAIPGASPALFYNLNWPDPGAFDEKISADQNQCVSNPKAPNANCAASNRGPYGAIMHIDLTIINNSCNSQFLEIGLGNHQEKGNIFGSGRFQNSCEFRTPHMPPGDYCVIGYFNAPANSGSLVRVDFAIGGGSTSPVVLTVRPVSVIGQDCSP